MASLAGKPITQNGLGLMRMTLPGGVLLEDEAFKVLKFALAKGVNVWNGADFYGTPDYNSLHLMRKYFAKYPEDADKVVLSIKSGIADMRTFKMDGSPVAMRNFVDNANAILDGKKKIDIFGCGRVDPEVPIEDTVTALAELVAEDKIGGIQLSEVSAETIRRASKITKIEMVEAEVSLWSTEVLENGVAEACAEQGIVLVAHSPLGAGILTGQIQSLDDMPANDYHRMFPRFQPENFAINLELVSKIKEVAQGKGCSPAELALSWIKIQSKKPGMPFFVPVAGARSEQRVEQNATDVPLSEMDLAEIESILAKFPVAGGRYPPAAAKLLEY